MSVDLPEQEWVDKVIAYLTTKHAIEHATGLDTYERLTVKPLESLDNHKISFNTHVGSYRRTSRLEPSSIKLNENTL